MERCRRFRTCSERQLLSDSGFGVDPGFGVLSVFFLIYVGAPFLKQGRVARLDGRVGAGWEFGLMSSISIFSAYLPKSTDEMATPKTRKAKTRAVAETAGRPKTRRAPIQTRRAQHRAVQAKVIKRSRFRVGWEFGLGMFGALIWGWRSQSEVAVLRSFPRPKSHVLLFLHGTKLSIHTEAGCKYSALPHKLPKHGAVC